TVQRPIAPAPPTTTTRMCTSGGVHRGDRFAEPPDPPGPRLSGAVSPGVVPGRTVERYPVVRFGAQGRAVTTTVADLLGIDELHLGLVAGKRGLDRPTRWGP